jgi:hypothetical protein
MGVIDNLHNWRLAGLRKRNATSHCRNSCGSISRCSVADLMVIPLWAAVRSALFLSSQSACHPERSARPLSSAPLTAMVEQMRSRLWMTGALGGESCAAFQTKYRGAIWRDGRTPPSRSWPQADLSVCDLPGRALISGCLPKKAWRMPVPGPALPPSRKKKLFFRPTVEPQNPIQ